MRYAEQPLRNHQRQTISLNQCIHFTEDHLGDIDVVFARKLRAFVSQPLSESELRSDSEAMYSVTRLACPARACHVAGPRAPTGLGEFNHLLPNLEQHNSLMLSVSGCGMVFTWFGLHLKNGPTASIITTYRLRPSTA